MIAKQSTLDELMADIQAAADLLDLPVVDAIWQIMRHYEQGFLVNPVGFRITTKSQQEMNVRYQTLIAGEDPYSVALRHGFLTPTDHPVHEVMVELPKRYPEAGYFIDLGVTHGFEKVWGYFEKPFTTAEVAAMDFLPPGIGQHMDLFNHYELDWVSVIGVDYIGNTANIYFMMDSFPNSPDIARQMVIDMGYPAPPEDHNGFNGTCFVLYLTFSWDSDRIERVSYARAGTADEIPAWMPAAIHDFAAQAPLRGDMRTFTFNTCYGHGIPDYYKLETDYRNSIITTVGPLIEGGIKARAAKKNGHR